MSDASEADAAATEPTATDAAAAAPSILIVDDTIDNLRLLCGVLEERGYETRPVTNGQQALQAMEHSAPDLVLLDIAMPEMDGFEVCRRMKTQPGLGDVPVIFLTAFNDTPSKVEGFSAGGVDYITKPFQIEEVLVRVKTHLELRRARNQLRRSYDRLEALERLRDDLVKMVVHDMRSPLTVLKTNLFVLSSNSVAGSERADDLQSALHLVDRISRMANDVLDVSRLEDDKLPMTRRRHDVGSAAQSIAAEFARMESARTVQVQLTGDTRVSCDESIVRRVLENLVGNAIKHTPTGGAVRISVAHAGDCLRVSVSDEGPGIPESARGSIFDKYETVSERAPRYHSAGLGLTFCKLAVEAHGGRIGVDCADVGSTFWFELPA